MFLDVPLLPVFVASIVVVALNSVWFSSVVCGKKYARSYGTSREELFSNQSTLIWTTLLSIGLYSIYFIALLKILHVTQEEISAYFVLATIMSVIVLMMVHTALWERRGVAYMLIHGLYIILATSVGYSIITYWPW